MGAHKASWKKKLSGKKIRRKRGRNFYIKNDGKKNPGRRATF